jgi:hypothetical protein
MAIGYFSLIDMWLSIPLIRALKQESNDLLRTQELLVTGVFLISLASIIVLFIGVIFSIFIGDLFEFNQEYRDDLISVFLILITSLSIRLISGVFGAAVYAKERIAHANIFRDVSFSHFVN